MSTATANIERAAEQSLGTKRAGVRIPGRQRILSRPLRPGFARIRVNGLSRVDGLGSSQRNE